MIILHAILATPAQLFLKQECIYVYIIQIHPIEAIILIVYPMYHDYIKTCICNKFVNHYEVMKIS